jgi:DNA transformation protein and related proteins
MSEFVDYLHEVFHQFGAITARKMFGGYGLYHDGLMFAMVSNDTLYLKADDDNAGYFVEQGLDRFEYRRNGKIMRMSYYQAPAELMEDWELAALWARRSYGAALRGGSTKKKSRTSKP